MEGLKHNTKTILLSKDSSLGDYLVEGNFIKLYTQSQKDQGF